MESEITEKTKKGIIYCRVSSAEQVEGTSLKMQEKLCMEYAEKEGIEIVGIFIEEGESAKTVNRTQFQKALVMCSLKKPQVDYFIVHKLDRFARNQDDHFAAVTLLRKYGTLLRSVSEPVDESPLGRMIGGVLAATAEFDNSIRSWRSKNGMIEKVKRGEWVWSAPLGYKRIRKGGNLVVDEAYAPYILFIFKEYAKGTHSFKSLAELAAKAGMRTRQGKKPCMQLVEKILRNHLYYGQIRAFGMEVKGDFEPIIDEDLFWKCQPKGKHRSHTGPRHKENDEFPLRRFVTCSVCGKKLTGSKSTGRKGKRYPYYHHHKQDCSIATSVAKETLEQNFVEYLDALSPRIKNEIMFREVVLDVWQTNFKKLDEDNDRIRREIKKLEDERQKVFDLQRNGTYTVEEFLEQKDILTKTISEKKDMLDEKRVEEFNMDEALEYCFNFVRDSGKTWKQLARTPLIRSRFQKAIFPEKVTFDGKKFGTTKLSLIYKVNQEENLRKPKMVTHIGALLEP